jgi:serine/threonine-protein kinase
MGEVYRGLDTRLGREVAIKVLPETFTHEPARRALFEREAKAVALVSHPNLLVLHDVGAEGDVAYAVTELLEGQTLRQRLLNAPLSWRKAVEVAAEVAEGLAGAHSRGVVHRDLKPENLFLTADGRVKILDFGLAHVETPAASGMETGPYNLVRTEPGVVMGTPGYMAPEQACALPTDARSDIFSLGCVLFEMLTGKGPFARASRAETMTALLSGTAPELPTADREYPAELARVVGRCLSREPTGRYQSANDLAHDLRSLVSGSPSLRPAPDRPRRSLPALAAVGILLVVIGVGLFLFFRDRTPVKGEAGETTGIDAVAVMPLENVGGDPAHEYLSDGLSESVINSLSRLRNLKVRPFNAVTRYRGQKPSLDELAGELKVQAILTGRVQHQGDRLYVSVELVDVRDNRHLWGDSYDRPATDAFAVQKEIARQIAETLVARLTGEEKQRLTRRPTENHDAFLLYLKGRHYMNSADISRATSDKAIACYQEALRKDASYALAHVGLAECYYWLSNIHMPPRQAIPEAMKAAAAALEIDDGLGEAHAFLGLFHTLYDWDWPAAEREFRRALALTPNSATVHQYRAFYLLAVGSFEEAIQSTRKARELDPSSQLGGIYGGLTLYLAHRYDEAIALLKELDPRRENELAQAFLGLACEQKEGGMADALIAFRVTAKAGSNLEGRAQLAHALAVVGRKEKDAEKTKEARKILAALQEIAGKQYVSPYNIALIYVGLDDRDRAFEWLEKAAEDHSEWFTYLKVDPRLNHLRNDKSFAPLLRHLNRAP